MAARSRLLIGGGALAIGGALFISNLLLLFAVMVAALIVAGGIMAANFRRSALQDEFLQAEIANKFTDARFRTAVGGGGVLAYCDGRLSFHQRQARQDRPLIESRSNGDSEAISADYPALLPELLKADRILIVGGMGVGKSTLLQSLITQAENPTMIDSHSYPGQWPCRTVGAGRDYQAIEAEINRIVGVMNQRYHERSQGVVDFEALTLFVDELSILNQCCDVSEQFKSLLCECRKVNIRLCFAGQSDRVKSLGIAGNGDLRDGFDCVCYLRKDSSGYYGVIDGVRFENEYHGGGLTGQPVKSYADTGGFEPTKPVVPVGFIEYFEPVADNSEAARIVALAKMINPKTGKRYSINQLCVEVFGRKTPQAFYKVKAALNLS